MNYKFKDYYEGNRILNMHGFNASPYWQVSYKFLPKGYPFGGQFKTMPVSIAFLGNDGTLKLLDPEDHENHIVTRSRDELKNCLESVIAANDPLQQIRRLHKK